MDPVRFGRVLGIGTRLAARTLVSAVDAATADRPAGTTAPASAVRSNSPASGPTRRIVQSAAQPVAKARATAGGLRQGGRRFGEAVWGPFARLSGVLWLEVTGVFFGLFAFLAAAGAWKQRSTWQHATAMPEARTHLFMLGAVAMLFAYFCVSSFVKANRRGRQK